jgi:DEAD/DEAH box helicase domain-containing protein
VWWQLPQATLEEAFAMRHEALDGFLGAAYALHLVAQVAVMAESRDLLKSVGSGDGAWFATADSRGRGQLRSGDGAPDTLVELLGRFTPTIYLYDNYPGGVGLSSPLFERHAALLAQARALVAGCDCTAGCPGCVGPILASDETARLAPKALAMRVLDLLAAA